MNMFNGKSALLGGVLIAVVMVCTTSVHVPAAFASAQGVVVDSLGRDVAIPSKVDRIGCLYAFTGHVVAMLGKADCIVAVSNGLKRDVLLTDMFPAIDNAVVPKYQGAINIEELAAVRPDIVFIQSQDGRNAALANKFDEVGLKWAAVDFHTMAQQRDVIAMIGKTIGTAEKAVAYNRYYLRCIERISEVTAKIAIEKRLRVYHSTVEPYRTSPKNSLPSDWIAVAGVVNVASQDPSGLLNGEYRVSMEQILFWNPDIILANEPGVADAIRKDPRWAPVTAVKLDRIYQLPIGISRWGHPGSLETPLAILWTAKVIYPEKFMHIDMHDEIKYFYSRFFNHELSDEMVEQILSGKGMRLDKKRK
jgi:iron complex transport system substrate-binding protein